MFSCKQPIFFGLYLTSTQTACATEKMTTLAVKRKRPSKVSKRQCKAAVPKPKINAKNVTSILKRTVFKHVGMFAAILALSGNKTSLGRAGQ